MPVFSFKKEFEQKILDGVKLSTIRRTRKDARVPCFAGDTLTLYIGMRTKHCRKLFITMCREVYALRINVDKLYLACLNNRDSETDQYSVCSRFERQIKGEELELVAKREGFENWSELLSWFKNGYPSYFVEDEEFDGYLVEWSYPAYMQRRLDNKG